MIASVHLQRVHGLSIARSIGHMGLDRLALSRTAGLTFWKLLGTGKTFSPRDADPTTWGLFCVWESADALERFVTSSVIVKGWNKRADEQWSATLEPLRWRGSWSGRQPFGVAQGETSSAEGSDTDQAQFPVVEQTRPVAALTRARIKPSQWLPFWRATTPVANELSNAAGLRFALGIGEAPIGLQATFSVWETEEAVSSFAYRGEKHRDVIRQTHSTGWYSEEMFARFVVSETTGNIRGLTK